MSFNEGDEVVTLVSDPDILKGTYSVISGVEEDGYWADVYVPTIAKSPSDCVLYEEKELNKH